MAGFLVNGATIFEHLRLALHLEANRLLHRTQGVNILRFGAGSEFFLSNWAQGQVGVHAHGALVHTGIGDAQGSNELAQGRDIGLSHLGRTLTGTDDRLGHNLNERDASAVAIH